MEKMNETQEIREDLSLSGKIFLGCIIAATIVVGFFLLFKLFDFIRLAVGQLRY